MKRGRFTEEQIIGILKEAEAGDRAIRHLEIACEALQSVSDECARASERFAESRRFQEDCDAAAALDSVEEMIRRRDELVARHARHRSRRPE